MKDYMQLLSLNHPGVAASCNGDPTVYENIVWHDPAIPQATLDSEHLAYEKALKNAAIDVRTKELIGAGFSFDSKTFSLSEPAQTNWLGLKAMEALLTWPVNITTKDDEEYSLTQANLDTFVGSGIATKQAHLDSGRALKVSVNAATTIAEVDAVVDNR